MPLIASRTNPKIKELRSLRQRKSRDESGMFLVEGIRHVGEAVAASADVVAIYYAPSQLKSPYANGLIQQQETLGMPCYQVSEAVLAALAEKEHPQGILAQIRQPRLQMEDLNPDIFPWGVALISPQDPGNLGAILRTIDAAGASGLVLLEGGVDAFHPTAVRASMGTIFWLRIVSTTFDQFSAWAKRHRYHIYGTSAHAEMDYRMVGEYLPPRILLLGSEREGLTKDQAEICECLVRLPMRGRATSLNLAVAAGVMLYAMLDRASA